MPDGRLSDNNIANTRPPARSFLDRLLLNKLPSASPNIHLLQLDPLGLLPEFIDNYEEREDRQQDIVDHEVVRAERVEEASVSLEKYKENIQRQREVGTPGIECSAEREVCRVLALRDKGFAEANMADSNDGPD